MFRTAVCCLALLSIISAFSSPLRKPGASGNPFGNEKETLDPSNGHREKRALIVMSTRAIRKGIQALKYLLKGTRETPTNNRLNYREFVKPGGWVQTLKDFHKVRPSNVRTFQQPSGVPGLVGTVGDRMVYIHNGGPKGKATLTLIKLDKVISEAIVDKITYLD